MENYLAPNDYEIAEKNGISAKLADVRFYYRGWAKADAITKPVRKQNTWNELYEPFKDVAVVSKQVFCNRVRGGWDAKAAATSPLGTRRKGKLVTKEVIAVAAGNGIKLQTLYHRVHVYGWSVEEAMTLPPGAKKSGRKWNYKIKKKEMRRGPNVKETN